MAVKEHVYRFLLRRKLLYLHFCLYHSLFTVDSIQWQWRLFHTRDLHLLTYCICLLTHSDHTRGQS